MPVSGTAQVMSGSAGLNELINDDQEGKRYGN